MKNAKLIFIICLVFSLSNGYGQSIPIKYGETISASISTDGEVDIYTFEGKINDRIIIRMTDNSVGNYLEPFLELYSPTGQSIITDFDNGQAELKVILSTHGNFTLFASDYGANDHGNYGLFIQRTFDPGNDSLLVYGHSVAAGISTEGEIDTYSFDGLAGDKIIIRMTDNSVGYYLEPFLELFSPMGDSLTSNADARQAEIRFLLPVDGRYTVFVSDAYPGDDNGGYGLFIQRTYEPGNVSLLISGQTVSMSISQYGEVDTYTFFANYGDSVVLRMSDQSVGYYLTPYIELFSPTGDTITNKFEANQVIIGRKLSATGFYTVFASDHYPGEGRGNYDLFYFNWPGTVINDPVLAIDPNSINFEKVKIGTSSTKDLEIVNVGGGALVINTISISGTDSARFDIDFDSLSLTANQRYQLPITFTPNRSGVFNAILSITSNGGNAQIALTGEGIYDAPDITLTIPDTTLSAFPGDTIKVPIYVNNAAGIAGAEIKIGYNPLVIQAIRGDTTSLTTSFSLRDSVSSNVIAFSLLRANGLTGGSGAIVNLVFQVVTETTDSSAVEFLIARLFAENTIPIPADTINGKVVVKITHPGTDTLMISPPSDTLGLNQTQEFAAFLVNNESSVPIEAEWQLMDGFGGLIGTLSSVTATKIILTATAPGDAVLQATYNSQNCTAQIIVGDKRGDVYPLDGMVNVQDAITTLRKVEDLLTLSPYQTWAADMTENGVIELDDAMLILDESVKNLLPKLLASSFCGVASVEFGTFIIDADGLLTVAVLVKDCPEVYGSRVKIQYNAESLQLLSIRPAAGAISVNNTTEAGKASISIINSASLVNDRLELVQLVFKTRHDIQDVLDLSLVAADLYDRSTSRIQTQINSRPDKLIMPIGFSMEQNYPNPFNPATAIQFELSMDCHVDLAIFNPLGHCVRMLVQGQLSAGTHEKHWDALDDQGLPVSAGVYFYRISVNSGEHVEIKKMILLK
ncbi:MAG TPA: choice-of-anchor D domain-containing protein [bacterium]|nr:choice-of-anchor D domain-containing protein [bacterium]HPG45248.1 choice-of-anchor D domain-containing protein [bacterium]HPM99033.1 choice-of-anchor D domain-containing protein [bacterium]